MKKKAKKQSRFLKYRKFLLGRLILNYLSSHRGDLYVLCIDNPSYKELMDSYVIRSARKGYKVTVIKM